MQEQEVEVSFCDLCGTSVPEGDLAANRAIRHEGKTVGGCCLAVLRAGSLTDGPAAANLSGSSGSGPGSTGPSAAGAAAAAAARSSDGGRLLTVGIVLLVALAGGVLFLESRLSSVENAAVQARAEMDLSRKADSEVLMDVAMRVEGMPDKGELQALRARADAIDLSLAGMRTGAEKRGQIVETELSGMRGAIRKSSEQWIDYRPLFEDLRQRQVRQRELLEALQAKLREAPAMDTAAAGLAAGGGEPGAPGEGGRTDGDGPSLNELSAELTEQVKKLADDEAGVRFGAVDLLIESREPKVLPFLLPLAKDPDAFVRRLTVEGLARFQQPEAVDALIAALADEDEYVCETAWRSLRDATGQNFPFDATASKDGRARAAERWSEWWKTARATFGS
ncbi:MAG: HEAT repeat domain-containing protein [Planctomycetota bacterium]